MLKKDLEKELNRTKLVLDYAREEIKTLKKDNLNLYNIICKNCGDIKTTDEEFKSLKKCNLIKEELEKIDD
jgi:DNA helicase IV